MGVYARVFIHTQYIDKIDIDIDIGIPQIIKYSSLQG